MASHLKTTGRFRSALRHLPEAARAEVASGLDDSIRAVQSNAIARAPVDTGRLRRALAAKSALGKKRRGLQVEYGLRTKALQKKAFYAPFVEYGTRAYEQNAFRVRGAGRDRLGIYRKMKVRVPARPARPFFRPAVEAAIPVWRRNMRLALKRAVARAARG